MRIFFNYTLLFHSRLQRIVVSQLHHAALMLRELFLLTQLVMIGQRYMHCKYFLLLYIFFLMMT